MKKSEDSQIKKILLIIEESIILLDIKKILIQNNYEILASNRTVFESLFEILNGKPDLIILSLSVIRLDKFLIKALTANSEIKLLVITGQNLNAAKGITEDLTVDFLLKPFTPEELLYKIENCAV